MVTEQRFLFWKVRTTYGGTFDAFAVDLTWRELKPRKRGVNPIISAWLSEQVREYLRQRRRR